MTAQERVQRNAEVFNARARGWSWPTIAAQFDLSERQVPPHLRRAPRSNRVCCRFGRQARSCATRSTLTTPPSRTLALLADNTTHDGTKLGAIRARLDAVTSKWELTRAIGVLPANLEQLWPEWDAQRVARTILRVLDDHQVSPEVQEEIVQAVERRHVTSVDVAA